MHATIIHVNGWPGVGKQTIGRVLANRLSARFIPNHLLHDVAIFCTGLNDPARWVLYEQVRSAAYAALGDLPQNETLVMTNALCENSQREQAAWRHVVELAAARQARLIPVVLEAAPQENNRRVASADRVGRKLTDASLLHQFRKSDKIQCPDLPGLLVLDTTLLSPDETAATVIRHLSTLPHAAP